MKVPGAEFDGGGPLRLQTARLVAAVAELIVNHIPLNFRTLISRAFVATK